MNPDQSAMDQFDLDVRVTTPRELAGADAQQFGTTTLWKCTITNNCGITTSAPNN
ncbi:FDLD family class I lanthipeptide [Allokutzneria oryzae]|uniref:FDLD family class I lanthipeptide n=1 Tax=Allokutzneria oryzae TaxID=1378989 RepID=A0ABV5ZSJ8_9PSEU